jgi:hypothetical protein
MTSLKTAPPVDQTRVGAVSERVRIEVHKWVVSEGEGSWWVLNRNAGSLELARKFIKSGQSPYVAGGLAVFVGKDGKPEYDKGVFRILRVVSQCTVIEVSK